MDDERLRITYIRQVARQLQIIHNPARHTHIALDTEAQHATKRALPQQLQRNLVRRVRFQAQIRSPFHLGMLSQVSCQGQRVVAVALAAQAERLEALQQEEGAEGVEGGPDVAQGLGAQLDGVRDGPECVGESEPVIPLGGFGEPGELPRLFPVELACCCVGVEGWLGV